MLCFSILICSLLAGVCYADDFSPERLTTNSSQSPRTLSDSVSKAAKWLLDQRKDDFSWGTWTPRAVVALAMAEEVAPLSKDDKELMVKQLNIQLSLELGSDPKTASRLSVSRLALFINALYATCQDPRQFNGFDLIRALRQRTDPLLNHRFSLPIVFLPLCFAGEIRYKDAEMLEIMYHKHHNKTDLQAIELMTLSCLSQLRPSIVDRRHFESRLAKVVSHFPNPSAHLDVYSLALMFQAMHSGEKSADVSSLVSQQQEDGSFGSLLATYYAIPALLGKNLLALGHMHCRHSSHSGRSADSPLFDSDAPKVMYSVWVGEGNDKDSHSITITGASNKTFYDIMLMAQNRNNMFRFSVDEMGHGKQVYSLAGVPNDIERENNWKLYKEERVGQGSRTPLKPLTAGVDRIPALPDDHFIFWFKKSEI